MPHWWAFTKATLCVTEISLFSQNQPYYRYDNISNCWQHLPENHSTFNKTPLKLRKYWDDEHLYAVCSADIMCVVLSEISCNNDYRCRTDIATLM